MLKTEIRREEMNEQRKGLNLEYLKNVVLTFLRSREEREQLLPVISTLLRLTPEENRALRQSAGSDVPFGDLWLPRWK